MEFVKKKLNKIYPVQTVINAWKLKNCLPRLKSSFDKDLKSTWFINSLVMDANPSLWGRLADLLPQELQSMPRWTRRWQQMQLSVRVIKQLSSGRC